MELAVLELGLKNGQISNVRCFLRIQTEAFRVRTLDLQKEVTETESVEVIGSLATYSCVLTQWLDIFSKIYIVLKAALSDKTSHSSQDFARKLCRIGLQTSNQLLQILADNPQNSRQAVQALCTEFSTNLVNQVELIRKVLHVEIKQHEAKEVFSSSARKLSGSEWQYLESEEVIRESLKNDNILLAQVWLARIRGVNESKWQNLCKKVFIAVLSELNDKNLSDACASLSALGFSAERVFKAVLNGTFDDELRNAVGNELQTLEKLTEDDVNVHNRLRILKKIYKSAKYNLNASAIRQLDGATSLLLPGLFSDDKDIFDYSYSQLDPIVAWTNFLANNEVSYLLDHVRNIGKSSQEFPFSWPFSQAMIELTSAGFRSTSELLLDELATKGMFSEKESREPTRLLKRIFQITPSKQKELIWQDHANHPLSNVDAALNVPRFQDALVAFAAEHEIFDFLIWFARAKVPSQAVSPQLNQLLSSYVEMDDKSDHRLRLKLVTDIASYVHDRRIIIDEMVEMCHDNLAILCLQLMTADEFEKQLCETQSIEKLCELASKRYPLIARSLRGRIGTNPLIIDELPTVYELLNGDTDFDVSKLFAWQTSNKLRNADTSGLKELPHFSHPKLAGLYGLKTSLTFLYYIGEGRPLEAFAVRTSKKSSSFSTKRVESACKQAALAAFFNCSKSEAAAAAVVFQEVLRSDSRVLRLHLAVANLVMLHAANYLGLSQREQLAELGNLLKKATYFREKRAPNKLLHLLTTALSRKYDYSNDNLIEECLEWKLAINFCQEYDLELPTDFLAKCAQSDDWLLFIIFAQMYDYPKEVVIKLMSSFNNGCIADHLEKAFRSTTYQNENDTSPVSIIKGHKKMTSASNLRTQLYNRIGVRQGLISSNVPDSRRHPSNSPNSLEDDMRSMASETDMTNADTLSVISRTSESGEFTIDWANPPKDFFSLLVLCQKTNPTEIWKPMLTASVMMGNHVFALMAASLFSGDNSSIEFDCFCCWLYAAFELPSRMLPLSNEPFYTIWNEDDFHALLKNALIIPQNFRWLLIGLRLFNFEQCPFYSIAKFFEEFLIEKEFFKSAQRLKSFQDQIWSFKSSVQDPSYMDKKIFVERTAVVLLECGLQATENSYELRILLRNLDIARIQSTFSSDVNVPDFRKLNRLCHCLTDTDTTICIGEFIDAEESSLRYKESTQRIVYSLQERFYFTEAVQFATTAGLSLESVLLNEWQIKASSSKESLEFWMECLSSIEKVTIPRKSVVAFMDSFLEKVQSIYARTYLLASKCKFIAKEANRNDLFESEINLWTSVLQMEASSADTQDSIPEYSQIWLVLNEFGREGNEKFTHEKLSRQVSCVLSEDKIPILDRLVGKLVLSGNIASSYRVAELFNFYSQDLALVDVCNRLANSKVLEEDALEMLRKLPAEDYRSGDSFSNSVSTLLENSQVILLLEAICKLATYAKTALHRITLTFKIACVLNKSYEELLTEKGLVIVKNLIQKDGSESIALARELINTNKIDDFDVARVIRAIILHELEKNASQKSIEGSVSSDSENRFLTLLRLLNDPSVLGKHLLDLVKDGSADSYPLHTAVDIYIKAHECFSMSSDIEGIAVVLRNVKYLVVQQLTPSADFASMIRILTKIGRYSEMTYIFDILRENHQFEALLGKGIDKVAQLRIALLDSLKGDKEMYPLVALNFSMHREIAEMLENDAMRIIRNVQIRRQPNAMAFREMLERSLSDFVDASESYTKATCYNQAARCGRLAELVALQINYLPSAIPLINLNEASVIEYVSTHTNCVEAIIVAEAYNHQKSWGAALFNNVILRQDWVYFREFQSQMYLSPVYLEEVANRFVLAKSSKPTHEKLMAMSSAVNRLLNFSNDAKLQVALLIRMGLVEATSKMMQDENGAYLRDIRRNIM